MAFAPAAATILTLSIVSLCAVLPAYLPAYQAHQQAVTGLRSGEEYRFRWLMRWLVVLAIVSGANICLIIGVILSDWRPGLFVGWALVLMQVTCALAALAVFLRQVPTRVSRLERQKRGFADTVEIGPGKAFVGSLGFGWDWIEDRSWMLAATIRFVRAMRGGFDKDEVLKRAVREPEEDSDVKRNLENVRGDARLDALTTLAALLFVAAIKGNNLAHEPM